MRTTLHRIACDLVSRRHIDAYVVTLFACIFSILSLIGDILSDSLRWAVALAGIGILVYRITTPAGPGGLADAILRDRSSFEERPFATRLHTAREVWIFAPSAVNVLSPQYCDILRNTVLARPDGVVKVVVINPQEDAAVRLAIKHLDDTLDQPLQLFRSSLSSTILQLRRMATWHTPGNFEYRLLDFNPGFSLVIIDPTLAHGTAIVEVHGFHHEVTTSRMHLDLTREISRHWYAHWLDQFDHIWQSAESVTTDRDESSDDSALRESG
jgi:hypothetical protein